MSWSTTPGSGDLGMASGDTLFTGTVSAQVMKPGYMEIGVPSTVPTSLGLATLGHIGATAPASGDCGANDGCLFVQSGQLMFLTGTGSVHALTGA